MFDNLMQIINVKHKQNNMRGKGYNKQKMELMLEEEYL